MEVGYYSGEAFDQLKKTTVTCRDLHIMQVIVDASHEGLGVILTDGLYCPAH